MTDRPKPPSRNRRTQLAAALRDNLKKRKAQARGREKIEAAASIPEPTVATKKA